MFEFKGVDFMDFDSLLSDEELLVRRTARQFVNDRFIPVIDKHFRDGTFPTELSETIAELGFFGANLHGYGCAGMSEVENGLIMQELERGDSGLRSFISVQRQPLDVLPPPLRQRSTEEQVAAGVAASQKDSPASA